MNDLGKQTAVQIAQRINPDNLLKKAVLLLPYDLVSLYARDKIILSPLISISGRLGYIPRKQGMLRCPLFGSITPVETQAGAKTILFRIDKFKVLIIYARDVWRVEFKSPDTKFV